VIFVQMSGMGDGGPWSKYVTYAPTIHALAGLTHMTGVEGREDIGIGFSYNDHQAGLHGAVAILAALEARNRTGQGQHVDISQFEVGVNFAGPALLDAFANKRFARPCGNKLPFDDAAPHGCYRCAPVDASSIEEERWIAIACMNDDQWQALVELMGRPVWAQDPALQTASGRVAAAPMLDLRVSEWTADQDAYDLMARAQAVGVPAGVVQTGEDMASRDPCIKVSNFLRKTEDSSPSLGETWIDALPIQFGATPCNTYRRVRDIGEDSEAVLTDWLKMSAEAIDQVKQQGVLK
ncbi:MAG: CoA transferase, partial [Proteobacteria bacterium]|nr:CoA transferase [Pseudomonadota bacterium]